MDDRGTAAYLQRRISPAQQAFLEVRRRRRAPVEYDDEHPSAASFYVPSLPGQPASSTLIQFAGHLPFSAPGDQDRKGKGKADSEGHAHAFWYLTKARHVAEKQVLVVWFNGG